jgi:ribosomal peptide maturation radical SAM protein 1
MEPTMVGFTCLFDQTIASANVAKLLKQARPDLPILLGGYAVQYENGLEVLRAFPWIDAIARGEGEPVIAPIARATAAGEDLSALPGVLTRERPFLTPLVPRADLRLSQPPDYDDWFADLAALEDEEQVALRTEALPIESSRGCWWGQRSHCTFCGIDEDTLKYRAKPPEQILAEIRHLRARYGTDHPLRFADYILPHHYHDTLLPALARLDPLPHLEAEMKANQTRERLQAFARAGFIALQPGIESFSTPVLKRMAKGVRAIQNVQLLKWGHLDRVVINYNLLFGFPGDQAAEYRWLVEHMPRLYHLIPPVSRAEVALTRFAPLFEDPERFGLPGRAPAHSYYRLLFSDAFLQETGFTLDNYAYYFDRNYTFSLELAELYAQLVIQVAHWKARHLSHHVTLAYVRRGEDYVFLDTRFDAREAFELKGPAARLYALCDDQAIAVEEAIVRAGAEGLSRAEVEQAIDTLDRYRVIWHSDGMMIGLGIPMEVATLRFRECWHLTWPSLAPLVRGQAPPAPLDLERSGEHVLA